MIVDLKLTLLNRRWVFKHTGLGLLDGQKKLLKNVVLQAQELKPTFEGISAEKGDS